MEVIKNKRILALIGIICLVVGCFLPYFSVQFLGISQSYSLWGYWEGKVIFTLTLANALFIFSDEIKKYVPQLFNSNMGKIIDKVNNPKFALIPTIIATAFLIYLFTEFSDVKDLIKYGLGFYTVWLGVLALIGHSIFYKKSNVPIAPVQYGGAMQGGYMQQPVQPNMNYYGQPQTQQPTQPQPMYNNGMQQPVQPDMNYYGQPQAQQPVQPQPMYNNGMQQPTQPDMNYGQQQQVPSQPMFYNDMSQNNNNNNF